LAADAPILDVAGLSASYGPVRVLHDVSFTLTEGESIAVLGANGAGKSTLLRAISGLMVRREATSPDRGPTKSFISVLVRSRRGGDCSFP
jgi:ABC-type sugar transport system ATPase subunit